MKDSNKISNKDSIVILISKQQIKKKVQELGAKISEDYKDLSKPLILVGVLKGSIIFLSDLCRAISIPIELEFIGVSSYYNECKSSGVIKTTHELNKNIVNRDILLVEDIVDTGLTIEYLFKKIKFYNPKSIGLVSLLEKPSKNKGLICINYCGFSIKDKFVIGYGLDLAGLYRNLPHICVVYK